MTNLIIRGNFGLNIVNNLLSIHELISSFVTDIDKVLNEICLAEFINSSCNMCLLGYYVVVVR